MKKNIIPSWKDVYLLVFDFDGVFTNNKVLVNNKGDEYIICSRGDGLAFDLLRQFINLKKWEIEYFILSREENKVVDERSKKLKIPCFSGVKNKKKFIEEYIVNRNLNLNSKSKKFVYVGNDLNDLSCILISDFSIVPKDSHKIVRDEADLIIDRNGGDDFVRQIVELLLRIDDMEVDDIVKLLDN